MEIFDNPVIKILEFAVYAFFSSKCTLHFKDGRHIFIIMLLQDSSIEIFIYSIAILLTTILFWWFTNLGYVFLVLSLLNNIIYSYFCYKLLIVKDRQTARNAYLYSLLHLALVFLFIVIDTLV